MKKSVLIMALGLALMFPSRVKADEIEVYHAWATAYCLKGTTAAGTSPSEGRTVAGKREWLGSTMIVWIDDGNGHIKPENFLGMYTVEDCGGRTIESGEVIDVYISDYEEAKQFGSKRVVFQIVPAEG